MECSSAASVGICSLEIEQAIQIAAGDINELQKQSPTTGTVQRLQVQKSKLSSRYRSGNNHHKSLCRFRQTECRNCGKVGHIAKVCRSKTKKISKKSSKGQATHYVLQDSTLSSEIPPSPSVSPQQQGSNLYELLEFPVKEKTNPIVLTVHVNKAVLLMELDRGASLSVINEDT